MQISATITKSEIFTLAHSICRFKDQNKVGNNIFRFLTKRDYRSKFAKALKYIYQMIKKAIEELNAPQIDFELCAYGKASINSTYKQYNYLCSFDNVSVEISSSQFQKRIEMTDASEAIQRAIAGQVVRIY